MSALVFLSWLQGGLTAGLSAAGTAGKVELSVEIEARDAAGAVVPGDEGPLLAAVQARLYGSGDVTGLDHAQLLRTEPPDGSDAVDPTFFAYVEFRAPELPWLFTPVVPKDNRLAPWLALVVTGIAPEHASDGLAVLTVPPAEPLPDLATNWAWAHVQVAVPGAQLMQSAVDDALAAAGGDTCSRLLCPRRLAANTRYYACVVPAFAGGRDAGLGLDPSDPHSTAPAWEQQREGDVRLPVYHSWSFQTGSGGSFEKLAVALDPQQLAMGVGLRAMDIGHAAPGLETPTAVLDLEGALRAPRTVPRDWVGRAEFQARLHTALAPSPKRVAPPLYGAACAHVKGPPGADGSPRWLAELNYDPRNRAAAGFGAEVVRREQEKLVAEAFEQLHLAAANDAIANLQVAHPTQTAIRRKCLPGDHELGPRAAVTITRPVLRGASADPVEALVTTRTVRRLSRPTGPLEARRRTRTDGAPLPTVPEQLPLPIGPREPPHGMVTLPGLLRSSPSLSEVLERADPARPASAREIPLGMLSNWVTATTHHYGPAWLHLAVASVGFLGERSYVAGGTAATRAPIGYRIFKTPVAVTDFDGDGRPDLVLLIIANSGLPEQGSPCRAWIVTYHSLRYDGTAIGSWVRDVPGDLGTPIVDAAAVAAADLDRDGLRRDVVMLHAVGARVAFRIASGWAWVGGFQAFSAFRELPGVTAKPAALGAFAGDIDGDGKVDLVVAALLEETADTDRLACWFGADLAADGVLRGGWIGPVVLRTGLPRSHRGAITFADAGGRRGLDLFMPGAIAWDVSPAGARRWSTDEAHGSTGGGLYPVIDYGSAFADLPAPGAPSPRQAMFERCAIAVRESCAALSRIPPAPTQPAPRSNVASGGTPQAAHALNPDALSKRRLRRMKVRGDGDGALMSLWQAFDHDVAPGFVLAAPRFDQPMYEALRDLDAELLLPGLTSVAAESVSIAETNPVFIEAFMVGLTHEMGRELLWRRFTTDPSATYFQRFWAASGPTQPPEFDPIAEWPADRPLGGVRGPGRAAAGAGTGALVLVLRGQLLQRFPSVRITAQRALAVNGVPRLDPAAPVLAPIFDAIAPPDVAFFGFDLTIDDALGSTEQYPHGVFLLLEEAPSAPRFGLDDIDERDWTDTPPPLRQWSDLRWSQLRKSRSAVDALAHLTLDDETALELKRRATAEPTTWPSLPVVAPEDPVPVNAHSVVWAQDAAALAHITYRAPIRLAIHASRMIHPEEAAEASRLAARSGEPLVPEPPTPEQSAWLAARGAARSVSDPVFRDTPRPPGIR